MIKRILVGLGGTSYTPVAIDHALKLAQAQDAELTGVSVLDVRHLRRLEHSPAAQRVPISSDGIEASIEQFEQSCKEAGVRFRVLHETGDAFTKLIDAARYHDLMVFGLRSVLQYDFLGADAHSLLIQLVGAGVRPLLAVSEEFRSISRVLIAYNGTMESAKAMKHFVQMRLWPGAELKIFTFGPSDNQSHELLMAAKEYCRAHGFSTSHESNRGEAKGLLLTAATLWRADLIVMGNSARSVLLRQVLGDTLLTALRDTRIPLFLAQ